VANNVVANRAGGDLRTGGRSPDAALEWGGLKPPWLPIADCETRCASATTQGEHTPIARRRAGVANRDRSCCLPRKTTWTGRILPIVRALPAWRLLTSERRIVTVLR
jgi:hypothetical protein